MQCTRWLYALLAATSLGAPAAARAQAPAERSAIAALRDSVAAMHDAAELAQLQRATDRVPTLRRAILAQRLGEVADKRGPYDAAMQDLGELLRRHPEWPELWYQLGLLKYALHEGGFPAKAGPDQRDGVTYLDGAAAAWIRALTLDPGLVDAVVRLTPVVLRDGAQSITRLALPALRLAAQGPAATVPVVQLDRGLVERELGNGDSAATTFRRYLAVAGDSGLGYLELARTLYDLGRPAPAESAYYAGAELAASDSALARYRADLAWIATAGELAGFDSVATGPARRAWLEAFWARRDFDTAHRPGERLAEHYRRWFYVLRNFRLGTLRRTGVPLGAGTQVALDRGLSRDEILLERGRQARQLQEDFLRMLHLTQEDRTGKKPVGHGVDPATQPDNFQQRLEAPTQDVLSHSGTFVPGVSSDNTYVQLHEQAQLRAYRSGQRLVDDRGVIYMRHGEPAGRAAYAGVDAHPNETWKYLTPDGPLFFHFTGTAAPGTLVDQVALTPELLATRGGLDVRYFAMAEGLRNHRLAAQDVETIRQENRRSIAIGTTTDGFALVRERPVTAVLQGFGLAHGVPGAGALVVFALPAGELTPERAAGDSGVVYPVRMRLTALDAAGRLTSVDTIRRFATARPLGAGDFLTGQFALPLPAGTYALGLVVSDSAERVGGAVRRGGIRVPARTGAALVMSDVVLGRKGTGQRWVVDGDTVALNPLDTYPQGATIEVYYQLGGLVPGGTYRTRIVVRPLEGGERRVGIEFTSEARTPAIAVSRQLSLGRLAPGTYVLEVTVQDRQGAGVTRQQRVHVVPR